MKPSWKSPELEAFLERQFGRTTAITQNRCIPAPIGCGKPIGTFKHKMYEKEYKISGLCQECQIKVFGEEGSRDEESEANSSQGW